MEAEADAAVAGCMHQMFCVACLRAWEQRCEALKLRLQEVQQQLLQHQHQHQNQNHHHHHPGHQPLPSPPQHPHQATAPAAPLPPPPPVPQNGKDRRVLQLEKTVGLLRRKEAELKEELRQERR